MSASDPTLGNDVPTDLGLESRLQQRAIEARLFGGDVTPVNVGRFVLLEPIGRGGMGIVYAAYDPQLDRRVAVKVLHPSRSGQCEGTSRVLREAQAMAKLVDPNVITVHEAAELGDIVFIAMELVDGETLGEWGRSHPPGTRVRFERLLDFAIQAASGLVAAHDAGLVHRDLKPANLLVGKDGRLRIADFGLARVYTSTLDVPATQVDDTDADSEPSRAAIAGTPRYMAPEQFEGQTDAGSDQWSLCATFWEVAYGEPAFTGGSVAALIEARRGPPPRPPACRGEVPTWFRNILLRGLAEDPATRHADVRTLLRLLERGRRRRNRRGRWIAGMTVAALGPALAVGLFSVPEPTCPTADAELQATWTAARRQRLEAAFVATGRTHAPATFALVSAQVSERARAIGAMRQQSCEATRGGQQSDSLLDLRSSCLDARQRQLAAVLEQWEQGIEPTVLDNSTRVVPSLSPLFVCADPELLRAGHPPPPAAQAEAVEALQREIEEADAAVRAGTNAGVRPRADELVARAETLGYAPALGRALRLRGRVEAFEDPLAALRSYEAASKQALLARDVEVELSAWLGVAHALEALHRSQEAQWALNAAQGVIERVGADPSSRLQLLHARSANALGRGDPDAAVELGEQALAHAEEQDADPLLVGRALFQLAEALAARGKTPEAVKRFERALALEREALGDQHPLVAAIRLQLGTSLLQLGRMEEGQREVEAARSTWTEVLGENHPHVAGATMILTRVFAAQGDLERALVQIDHAIAIFEAVGGPSDPNLGVALSTRGLVLRDSGRLDDSERDLLRSLELREARHGAVHPEVAESVTNLGNLAWARDDFATALEHHDRALAIKRQILGQDAPGIALALINLGMTELRLRRWDDAHTHHLEAIEILQPQVSGDDHHLVLAYVGAGEAALERGEKAEARRWLEAALPADVDGTPSADADRIRALLERAREDG